MSFHTFGKHGWNLSKKGLSPHGQTLACILECTRQIGNPFHLILFKFNLSFVFKFYLMTCIIICLYHDRAESAHSRLKRQLGSSKGSFSDNWAEINKLLLLQHTDIKASFQKSLNHYQHTFRSAIYKELRGFVSLFALEKIMEEVKKARDLVDGPFEHACECNIRATH